MELQRHAFIDELGIVMNRVLSLLATILPQ
jgi:hypothetical protein